MEKVFISNHIKFEILKICGLPVSQPYNLAGETRLGALKCNCENFYQVLEVKLQEIASHYNTGKVIPAGIITKAHTVNQCIQLVFA